MVKYGTAKAYQVSYQNVDQYGNVDPHVSTTTVYGKSKDEAKRTLERNANYKIVVTRVVVGGV